MSKIRYILLVAMIALIAPACQRRPLVEEDLSVILKLDIDYNIPHYAGAKSAKHMRVSFFDAESDRLRHVEITGPEGGLIHVPAGDYKMLIHNTGTESTQIRGKEQFLTTEAYTNEISRTLLGSLKQYLSTRQELLSLKNVSEGNHYDTESESNNTTTTPQAPEQTRPLDERIVYTPNHLFVASDEAVNIPIRIAGDAPTVIEATARSVVESWYLEVRTVSGIENIGKVTALITGMVGSNFIADNMRTEEAVTIYENMTADRQAQHLTTIFNTFGKQPSQRNILSVVITDIAGGQYQYNFDISDQFVNNPERKIIINTDINIPRPEFGGGGFKPSVDDWDEEHTDIEL